MVLNDKCEHPLRLNVALIKTSSHLGAGRWSHPHPFSSPIPPPPPTSNASKRRQHPPTCPRQKRRKLPALQLVQQLVLLLGLSCQLLGLQWEPRSEPCTDGSGGASDVRAGVVSV